MTADANDVEPRPGIAQGIVLLLPITMAVMAVSVLPSVLPLLVARFRGVMYAEYLIPILMMVPLLWIVLFSPFAGWLADIVGRRKLLIGAMAVYAVAGTAPIYLNDIWLILASRCGVGISVSIVMTLSTTLISDYFSGKQRTHWLAAQTLVASLSALVIIPLGEVFGSWFGWRGPFYLYAYSLLLMIGVIKYTWEPSSRPPGESYGEDSSGVEHEVKYHDLPWLRLLALGTLTLLSAEMFYGVLNQGARALGELGVHDQSTLGMHATWAGLGIPLGTVIYRYLSHLNVELLVFLAFALLGGGFWCLAHSGSPIDFTIAAFTTQLGCGLIMSTLLVWTTAGLAHTIRGRGHGIWQSAFMAGQLVSGVTIAYFAELSSVLAAFNVLAAIALLISLGALVSAIGLPLVRQRAL